MAHSITQFDEDSYRLPEGFRRIGYDTDTQKYTFVDQRSGRLYSSEPGSEYGRLTPVRATEQRPEAFFEAKRKPSLSIAAGTFQDILPPEMITSPPSQKESSFQSLKRSVTSVTRKTRQTGNAPNKRSYTRLT